MMKSVPRRGRSSVVTGAGAGLGREIALGLAARGHIVFGTAESSAEAQDLKDASGGRVSLTVCDTSKAFAVDAWASGVAEALGPAGLDLLINNAAHRVRGPVEALPLDAIRHTFEMNVFGVLSVTNAYLPALRSARGRIVQISGWTGRVPLAFDGASGASRAAIEAFSAVYRAELKPFGIDVILVQHGALDEGEAYSDAAPPHPDADMTPKDRKLYGKAYRAVSRKLESLQATGMSVEAAAALIIDIAEGHPAASRAVLGVDAERMVLAAREMTDAELDALCLQVIGLS